jgi:hypothetical protein
VEPHEISRKAVMLQGGAAMAGLALLQQAWLPSALADYSADNLPILPGPGHGTGTE